MDTGAMTKAAALDLDQHTPQEIVAFLGSVPNRTEAQCLILGRSYLKLERLQEAIDELEQASTLNPKAWAALYYLGCAYGWQGKYRRAEEYFSQALTHRQDLAPIYVQRGHARLKRSMLHEAAEDYLAAERLGAGPAVAQGYACLGLAYGKEKEHERAYRALSRALALGVEHEAVQVQFERSCHKLGRHREALAILRGVLPEHVPTHALYPLFTRLRIAAGLQSVRQRRWKEAAGALCDGWPTMATTQSNGAITRALAMVCLLGGARNEAVALLETAQRLEPSDGFVAHALLLSQLGRAQPNLEAEEAARKQRTIRNAVLLLHDEPFWESWRAVRTERYRVTVSDDDIASVKQRLVQFLTSQDRLPSSGAIALHAEMAGAQALKDLAVDRALTFAAPRKQDPEHPEKPDRVEGETNALFCGVIMLRHLRLAAQFGTFVHKQPHRSKREVANGTGLSRLFRYFSSLAEAQVLLDRGRAQQALDALKQTCCAQCALPPNTRPAEQPGEPRVCRETCVHFDVRNPAFAAMKQKGLRLRQEAAALAAEIHLALATEQVSTVPVNLAAVRANWTHALRLAEKTDAAGAFQERWGNGVLGRARALVEQDHLDEAVGLLQSAHGLSHGPVRSELGGRLAEVLHFRAIEALNQAAWADAAVDLRHALALNPHIPRRIKHLVYALRKNARSLFEQDQPASVRLFAQARHVLEEGLRHFPNHEGLQEAGKTLTARLLKAGAELNAQGRLKAEAGDYQEALDILWLAYELTPQDTRLEFTLCQVSQAYAIDLLMRRHYTGATDVLQRALAAFPQNRGLLRARRTFADLMNQNDNPAE